MSAENWRRIRSISLPIADDVLLNELIKRIEKNCQLTSTNASHVVRVALQCLNKLPDQEIKKAFNRLPPTRFGKAPEKPRPKLTDEEWEELYHEVGYK